MNILIQSVHPSLMRYGTFGDWFYEESDLIIQVSSELSEDEQFLVALHELIEVKLCEKNGITQKQVDDFDFNFKSDDPNEEPGDHPDAPYRKQHRFAMLIEHLAANELGIHGYGTVR